MRYIMRQHLFSWGDDFTIKTEDGRNVFFVDGKAFSLGNQLSFQDMQGNELAFIRQKLLSWGPTLVDRTARDLPGPVRGFSNWPRSAIAAYGIGSRFGAASNADDVPLPRVGISRP
jgi:hypothetical protein